MPHRLRAALIALASVVIFFALWFAFMELATMLVYPLVSSLAPDNFRPIPALVLELAQFLPVVAATLLFSRFEQRPLLSYGFQGSSRALRFVSGLVCGFVALSVLVFALCQLRDLRFAGRLPAAAPAFRDAILWAVVFLITAFFEESLMRGYAQFTLARGLGFWWSALILSIGFGCIHSSNPGESPLGLVAAGAIGLVFCLSLWYTGSLWWAIGFHASWDWAESFFYGTPDSGVVSCGRLLHAHPAGALLWSGGSTGPEGSLLIFPLMAAIALLMVLWWNPRTRSPFAGQLPDASSQSPADS